jgi:hypothetical protein
MGRTLPSATQIVFGICSDYEPLYYATPRADQLILDKFFEGVKQHRAAIDNAKSLLPAEMIPVVILLEERKRNNLVFNELYRLIEKLEKNIEELKSPAPAEASPAVFMLDANQPANELVNDAYAVTGDLGKYLQQFEQPELIELPLP